MAQAWRGCGALAGRAHLAADGGRDARAVDLRDNDPAALRFAEARGFARERHRYESTLDLASFDEAPFARAIARAEAAGYCFFSLADVGDTEEARRRDYEVNRRAALDTPGAWQTFMPFEDWRRLV